MEGHRSHSRSSVRVTAGGALTSFPRASMRRAQPTPPAVIAGRVASSALLNRPLLSRRVVSAAAVSCLLAALLVSYAFTGQSASVPSSGRSAITLSPALLSLPAAAQLPVSAALGAADRSYRVTASAGGFQAANPAQRLHARFLHSGVSLSSGALHLALSLPSLGEGSSVRTVADLNPSADGNRLTYSAPGLSEWFLNGPLGLEQGFTVASAPTGDSPVALTLSIALSGNAHAALIPGGLGVSFTHPGSASLTYTDLSASDASGALLHSSFALHGGRLLLRVDTRGARYPIRIDPLVGQGAKLSASEEDAGGLLGLSVALSADGQTALIGAPREAGFTGAAWVFARSGSTWVQQGKALTPSGEPAGEPGEACEEAQGETDECAFGASVALSGNGDTALIGAPRENEKQGAAWVFTRSGSTWSPQGVELTGGEEERPHGRFGASVALSADGTTALIGAPADRSGTGAAWVFTHSGSTWVQQGARLTAAPRDRQGHFGRSVALSADGDTALIGAPADAQHLGAAWVFTRSGETWTQQGSELTGGEEAGAGRFGFSTALSADGNTALIGARSDDEGAGAAWVFTRAGEAWAQQGAKLTGAGESDPGEFGYSVALSSDGDTAIIGAPRDSRGLGGAWVFTRSGETWEQQADKRTAGAEPGRSRFGASVALSADASIALIGAPANSRRLGAVWTLWEAASPPPPPPPPPTVTGVTPDAGPALGATTVAISGTDFSHATAVSFGSEPAVSFTVNSPTSLTAVSPAAPQGTVDLTVTTPVGTSEASTRDLFTFLSAPVGSPGPPGSQRNDTPPSSPAPGASARSGVLAFGPAPASPAGACTVSLHSRTIRVHDHIRASLALTRTGSGRCLGTVTLEVRVKGKRGRFATRSIGTASFSIAPGASALINIHLNRWGRMLLSAAHGHLSARLAILRLSPAPRQARTAAVHLALAVSRPPS